MKFNANEVIFRVVEADEDTIGKFANQAADSYRQGADLRTLVPLLEHSDSRLVSVAAWIVSEVVDGVRGREVFDAIAPLLHHSDPAVRFSVIESVAMLVRPEEHSIIHELFMLAVDPNPGVRQQALCWLCRIPDVLIEHLQHADIWLSARLLLGSVSKAQIRAAIKSVNLFDQRMAIAGAVRNFGNDNAFLDEIRPFFDQEVAASFSRLLVKRTSEAGA